MIYQFLDVYLRQSPEMKQTRKSGNKHSVGGNHLSPRQVAQLNFLKLVGEPGYLGPRQVPDLLTWDGVGPTHWVGSFAA